MKSIRYVLLAVTVLFLSGCYHARIETGRTPSAVVIEDTFASSWVYGLVPPKTVEAAEECEQGVAIVETRLSFVNQLVGALTWGIYTPMHIKVTCAAGSGAADALSTSMENVTINRHADKEEQRQAFQTAVDHASDSKQPVVVRFE